MDEGTLRSARLKIARLVPDAQDAQEIALLLASTDWEKFYEQDTRACDRCHEQIQYHKLIQSNTSSKKYCVMCLYKVRMQEIKATGHFCAICETYGLFDGHGICRQCCLEKGISQEYLSQENHKILAHNSRAQRVGCIADLRLWQWTHTLAYFDWKCAYCQQQPYEQVEHFIPITKGGGTTRSNCIPSCKCCNDLKGKKHPDHVTRIPQEAIARVQTYLQQFLKTTKTR